MYNCIYFLDVYRINGLRTYRVHMLDAKYKKRRNWNTDYRRKCMSESGRKVVRWQKQIEKQEEDVEKDEKFSSVMY